jgi:hypothetical protein
LNEIQIQLKRNKIHDGARGIQVFFMFSSLHIDKCKREWDIGGQDLWKSLGVLGR